MRKAVFPGSFDPLTLGHCDIINRGITLFDEVVVAIGVNSDKQYMFSIEERLGFIKETFGHTSKVSVETYQGLTVDFCKNNNINFILRGLRNPADFEFEKAIAHTNRKLSGIETIFLLTSAETAYISSSIVREVIRYSGNFSEMVPNAVKLS